MAIQKLKIDFNAGRQGWKETYYLAADSLYDARPDADALVLARFSPLWYGYGIDAATLYDPRVPRSKLRLKNSSFGQRLKSATNDSYTPWEATHVRLSPGSIDPQTGKPSKVPGPGPRRTLLVRGLVNDSWLGSIGAGWTYNPERNRLDQFLTLLTSGPYGMMADLGVTSERKTITALTIDGVTGNITITATGVNLHLPVLGRLPQYVTIQGLEGVWKPINGRREILSAPNANTFTIGPIFTHIGQGILMNGTARGVRMDFQQLSSYRIVRPVKRSTGRASHVTAGRNKRRPKKV